MECRKVAWIMKDFKYEWGIAGGWALDLFQGRKTRDHHDIEIVIFRSHQHNVKDYLKDWEFRKVINGEFQDWGDEHLTLPIHEIHAVHRSSGELIEILLNEMEKERWVYRRDARISRNIQYVMNKTEEGIPYLQPEIVLLYKAKHTRHKDDLDFYHTLPCLNQSQRDWLKNSIELSISHHKWLADL
ncbi:hypothetical protein FZW96_06265 [Bacillus sp. BGMRC 2118]|nr:hypothetical protein FZW96_06265 [Bacillus sp. BGMRC 2118]